MLSGYARLQRAAPTSGQDWQAKHLSGLTVEPKATPDGSQGTRALVGALLLVLRVPGTEILYDSHTRIRVQEAMKCA